MLAVSRSKWMTPYRRGGLLQGCLVAVIIVVVMMIIGGVLVAINFKKWSSSLVVAAFNTVVDVSEIPATEKVEIKEIIAQVRTEYLAGNVTMEEVGQLLSDFETNPAIAMGMVMQFEAVYVKGSSLTDEQKEDARVTLNRISQGLVTGVLAWRDVEPIVDAVSDVNSSGNRTFRQASSVRESEVLGAIESARKIADDAGIGSGFVEYDISDEFKRSIEKTLGRTIGG